MAAFLVLDPAASFCDSVLDAVFVNPSIPSDTPDAVAVRPVVTCSALFSKGDLGRIVGDETRVQVWSDHRCIVVYLNAYQLGPPISLPEHRAFHIHHHAIDPADITDAWRSTTRWSAHASERTRAIRVRHRFLDAFLIRSKAAAISDAHPRRPLPAVELHARRPAPPPWRIAPAIQRARGQHTPTGPSGVAPCARWWGATPVQPLCPRRQESAAGGLPLRFFFFEGEALSMATAPSHRTRPTLSSAPGPSALS